jgi:serine/threonine-protein kinase
LPQLPITVDISVDKPYSIVASKKGFSDFEEKVAFDDGQAERTFVVDLSQTGSSSNESSSSPGPTRAPSSSGASGIAAVVSPKASASGNGTLNINAIPVSNVLVDGRPMGQTPKMGVSLPPGSHTVMFVNADHGRKSKTVTVEAGKSQTVVVRFP